MIEVLLQPFDYGYMVRAMLVCALVGGVCAFLSAFLMLRGWSLIGDALAHCVVPGVALAAILRLPYAVGALLSAMLASAAMTLVRQRSPLKEDVAQGLVFTTFLAFGLFIVSVYPTAVRVETIVLGNILAISDWDLLQVAGLSLVTLAVLLLKWRDLLAMMFDEAHARSIGLRVERLELGFMLLLSAAIVAALQAVGAVLVVAMVITPGAAAHLLTDRFPTLVRIAVVIGIVTSALGAYLSFFLDGATGGIIVVLQTLVFMAILALAPRRGLLAGWLAARRARVSAREGEVVGSP